MVEKELTKLKWIKIVMCVFLIIRTYQIVVSYYYYQLNLMTEEILFTGFYALVLLGLLFTKYEILFASILILIQYKFDDYYHCHAVNSNIVCFISFFIVVVQFNRKKWLKNIITEQQFLKRINHFKFTIVAFWSLLHFVSVFVHFSDINWTNGKALGLVLSNPFLSKFCSLFQDFNLNSPELFQGISTFFSYTFLFFQITMFLFFIIKKTRFIFYLWFFLFNVGVTVFVNAAFLPHFAWLLFLLLIPANAFSSFKLFHFGNEIKIDYTLKRSNFATTVVLSVYVLLHAPIINTITQKTFWVFREWDTYKYLDKKLTMVGLTKLNVFNSYQIANGLKWFSIYKKENNQWVIVPIVSDEGKRLSYQFDWIHACNHGSDFLFFANTFLYSCGIESVNYQNSSTPYKLPGTVYQRLIQYDKNRYSNDCKEYKVNFYSRYSDKINVNPYIVSLDSSIIVKF